MLINKLWMTIGQLSYSEPYLLAGIENRERQLDLQRIRDGEEMSGFLVASVLGAELRGMADAASFSLSRNGSSSCTTDCCTYATKEGERMKEVADHLKQPQQHAVGTGDEFGAGEGGEGSPLGCPHRGCAHKAAFGGETSKAKAILEIATHHMVEHVLEEDDVKQLIIAATAKIDKKNGKKD
jgi:hypothetical protein